jgi:exopolysaccharide biosynthesis predicted pyruvyltransferase EpsI
VYFLRDDDNQALQKARNYFSSLNLAFKDLRYNSDLYTPKEPAPHCDVGYVLVGKERNELRDVHLNRSWLERTCAGSVARVYLSEVDFNDMSSCQADLRCCVMAKQVYPQIKRLVGERSWYVVANDDTFVLPDNIVRFVNTLKQDEMYLVGGDGYTALHEGEYLSPRRLPFGALEDVRLESNIRVLSEHSGYVLSRKLAQQLEEGGSLLEGCEKYNLANITLPMVARDFGAKIVRHQGFNPSHPFDSFMFEENYMHTLPLTFNMAGKEEWMPLLRFLINEKQFVPRYNGKIQTEVLPEDWNGCLECIGLQQTMLADYYSRYINGLAKVALVAVPDSPDRAGALTYMGEKLLLERLGVQIVHVCYQGQPCDTKDIAQKLGSPQVGFVMLHGGNNVGDNNVDDLRMREQVIHDLPDYQIITFPHTLKYSSEHALAISRDVFQLHKHLTVITRDPASFALAKKQFKTKDVQVGDLPDVAFMIGNQVKRRRMQTPQFDIFFHSSSKADAVQELRAGFQSAMQKVLSDRKEDEHQLTFGLGDWEEDVVGIEQYHTVEDRALARTMDAIHFTAIGRVVITDNLHSKHLCLLLFTSHLTDYSLSLSTNRPYGSGTQWHPACHPGNK